MIDFIQPLMPGINLPVVLVVILIIGVALAFFREWGSPDVVALSALGVIILFGLLPISDVIRDGVIIERGLLSVFSNGAPITIAAMFVLSTGLERTGAIDAMGKIFTRVAGKSELRVLLVLMFMCALLSAFINNTPIVVVFLPIVLAHARATGLKASKLLIPLSFASILGGTCTLTGTSTNLIIDGVAQEYGQRAFTMFEMSKLGLVYAAIGFVYLATIGRKLLPNRSSLAEMLEPQPDRDFLTQFVVEKESNLIGKPLTETLLKEFPGSQVLEVRRRGRNLETSLDQLEIREMDRLLVTLHGSSIKHLHESEGVRFPAQAHLRELETRELKLIEGIVGPRSNLVGKTLEEIGFRRNFGVHVLAIHRQGMNLSKDFNRVRLAFGDTLLMEGPTEAINRLQQTRDFVIITEPTEVKIIPGKLRIGIAITAAFILGASFQILPIPALALLAALAMILFRCVTAHQAYEAVQWNIVFLIFGMLALGLAMDQTGTARLMVEGIMHVFGNFSPFVILAVVYLLSSTLTELISNNAVAALLTPIVIGISKSIEYGGEIGVDPRPFIIALMFGCSASFATPIGYQTNTYVYGAGGYQFKDFPRVGVPLNLILWIVASILIPILWPFR
ncbi:MAG: SLC13 family permease [Verrucomicrobiae bacterium]|nr:SLC13 family permease [Verrucomicrobiae bacterium]